jgi:hypothetical protein
MSDELAKAGWTAVETLEDAATALTNEHIPKLASRCELAAQALNDALRAAAVSPEDLE